MTDCEGCGSHQLQSCLPGCDGGEAERAAAAAKRKAKRGPPPPAPLPAEFDGAARFFLVVQEARVRRFRAWRFLALSSPDRYRIRLVRSAFRGAWLYLEERTPPLRRGAWRPVETLEPWDGPTTGPWTRPTGGRMASGPIGEAEACLVAAALLGPLPAAREP